MLFVLLTEDGIRDAHYCLEYRRVLFRAPADQQAAYIWVVTRHEIDYRGNLREGEAATGETWVPDPPRGARFDRHVRFTGADGAVKVEAVTTWSLLDRAPGRVPRVGDEVAATLLEWAAGVLLVLF